MLALCPPLSLFYQISIFKGKDMVQKFVLQALNIVGWVFVSNEHDQGLGQDLHNCHIKKFIPTITC